MKKNFCFWIFLFLFRGLLLAQQPPFWSEIQAFKIQDSIAPPAVSQIVFTGSSSFRLWKTIHEDFPGYPILNRGFGGSILPDVIRYVDEVVIKYRPKQVVIYCGDNDLAADTTINGKTVFKRFKTLQQKIHHALPDTKIVYVSIKPSPSRMRLIKKVKDANRRIKNFTERKIYLTYADVFHPMMDENQQPRGELFIGDRLHMNAEGYKIWTKVIKPYLVK